MASFAKEKTTLRNDIRFIDDHLSGINLYELIVSGEENTFKEPDVLNKLETIESALLKNNNVLKVFGINNLVKTINKALHEGEESFQKIPENETEVAQYLFLYEISGGDELSSFCDDSYSTARITIRTKQMSNKEQNAFLAELKDLSNKNFENLTWNISGFGMLMNHINENLISTQISSIIMALGIILLLMFFLFGIKGGLLSILPNIFPIIFFLGLMGIFGIDLNMATSIIAAVTIGIVVDDTIHIFYSYKKEMKLISIPSISIKTTLIKTGAALSITSLILTLGFGILIFSQSKFISDFGIMSASAIATALLGDLFISPIILKKSQLFNNQKLIKIMLP